MLFSHSSRNGRTVIAFAVRSPSVRVSATRRLSQTRGRLCDADGGVAVSRSMSTFKALVVREAEEGNPKSAAASIEELTDDDLPVYDGSEMVTVDIDYSSLNYKDGMALTGKGRIIRSFPMVPGIDFSGTVVSSDSDRFAPGDGVILTGWAVGERYWGGYSQRQRVKADWLVARPASMTSVQAMGIGTAGLTSMLCVLGLEAGGVDPERRTDRRDRRGGWCRAAWRSHCSATSDSTSRR